MNTRRKFLLQGSMTTAALLLAKPFTSMANGLAPVTGFSMGTNKLALAHTGDNLQSLNQISGLRNSTGNLLLLNVGTAHANTHTQNIYDASVKAGEHSYVAANDYKILHKDDIKTGIINADAGASVNRLNELAVYLKKEKGCQLVVCMSQLGYSSQHGIDDLALAAGSTHIDIILGGHAVNFCKKPVIAQNKHKEEVIINHAADKGLALRKIELGFDGQGRKKQVAFTKTIPAHTATA